MLPKIWKKILLIILIIACLFNITIKLVHRQSLKSQLENVLIFLQQYNTKITAEEAKNALKVN